MRLTLRTMLAFLDDILEPDDAEDVGKKIEESEFASNLVHRTRDCMRRLRLGTPSLMGRGLGGDPNTVAEYLDNTLPAEQVPEFEKICLESDVHLAEVASCHQILTLVLGEPAEIAAESRQRMYQLATHVDAPPIQHETAPLTSPTAAPAGPSAAAGARRARPEVPDYLREPRRRWWPVAAMVAVGALVAFGALAAFGPAGFRRQVATLWQSPAAEEEAAAASDDTDKQAADKKSSDQAPTDRSEKAAAGEPHLAADAPSVDTPTTEPATEPTPAPNEISEPKAIVPPAGAAEDATAPTAPEPPAATTPSSDDADAPPPLAIDDASAPATQPAASPPTDEAMPKDARAAAAAPVRQEPADGFGRFTSKKDVLLRFDSAAANWPRLASMSPLAKGDQLMSLPLFRPAITLSSSITVQCDGPAKFELAGWSEAGVPIIAIDYGKFLMLNGGKAANPLELKLGDTDVQLTFVDPESEAALEVRHVLPPGQNPEAGPAPLAVELYAKSGTLRIRDGAAANELKAPPGNAWPPVAESNPLAAIFPSG